jgi:hypothetical protein
VHSAYRTVRAIRATSVKVYLPNFLPEGDPWTGGDPWKLAVLTISCFADDMPSALPGVDLQQRSNVRLLLVLRAFESISLVCNENMYYWPRILSVTGPGEVKYLTKRKWLAESWKLPKTFDPYVIIQNSKTDMVQVLAYCTSPRLDPISGDEGWSDRPTFTPEPQTSRSSNNGLLLVWIIVASCLLAVCCCVVGLSIYCCWPSTTSTRLLEPVPNYSSLDELHAIPSLIVQAD